MGNYASAVTTCDFAFSCWEQIFNEVARCHGFSSCLSSSILINNGWDANVEDSSGTILVDLESIFQCYGSYSCMNSTYYDDYFSDNTLTQISNIIDSYVDVDSGSTIIPSIQETLYLQFKCFGFRSCAAINMYSNLIQDFPMNIMNEIDSNSSTNDRKIEFNCSGDQSCANGTLINTTRLYCYGERSCWNAKAEMARTEGVNIRAYGHLAAQNATFILNGGGSVTFVGDLSGYQTKVICQNNQTCQINCYSNACNYIQVECKFMDSDCLIKLSKHILYTRQFFLSFAHSDCF